MKLARPKVHAELRLAAEDEDVAAAELTARRPEDARPLPPRLDAAAAARDDNVAVRARLVDPLEIESDLHAARAAREDRARLPRVDEGAATNREPHAHPPAALKQPALQLQRLLALDGDEWRRVPVHVEGLRRELERDLAEALGGGLTPLVPFKVLLLRLAPATLRLALALLALLERLLPVLDEVDDDAVGVRQGLFELEQLVAQAERVRFGFDDDRFAAIGRALEVVKA